MDEMIQNIAEIFQERKIPYVVIGGIASSLLGKPRMTMDADIVVLLSHDAVPDLLLSIRKKGFSVTKSSEPKMIARLRRGLPIKLRFKKHYSIDLRLASYKIDIKAIERAEKQYVFDVHLPIVKVDDLIVYKLVRFDEIDQADIKAIVLRQKKKIHTNYLIKQIDQLVDETGRKEIRDHLNIALAWI